MNGQSRILIDIIYIVSLIMIMMFLFSEYNWEIDLIGWIEIKKN